MVLKFAANLNFLFFEGSTIAKRILLAHAAGFKAVEIPCPDEVDLDEVLKAKNETGVEISLINIALELPNFKFGMASTPGKEEDFKVCFHKTIKHAKMLNCKKIHIMAGLANGEENDAFLKTYKTNLKYADSILGAENIVGLIEPINGDSVPLYFMNCYEKAMSILKDVQCQNIKILADLFHMQKIRGNITSFFKEHADSIGHIQFAQVPHRHEPDVVGELDFEYIFALIDEFGYDDWIGCEYTPRASTVEGLKWLKKYHNFC